MYQKKKKPSISCSYNGNKSMIGEHMEVLIKSMDFHSIAYESLNFLGDFNAGIEHVALK